MPHVPNFPTPSDETDEDGRDSSRRGIIDRIIDDGNWPSPTGAGLLPTAEPSR